MKGFIRSANLIKNFIVMREIVGNRNKHYIRERKSLQITHIEPPKLLFKVVVNNYNHQEKEIVGKIDKAKEETLDSSQVGLPPQPTMYLKYPAYDWL
ncbi:MAG TPA: hypothetical protein VFU29_13145 [Chitinophagaceae bacterium]|nr:hypothetical protein [Chitinophagaceae bacterium]